MFNSIRNFFKSLARPSDTDGPEIQRRHVDPWHNHLGVPTNAAPPGLMYYSNPQIPYSVSSQAFNSTHDHHRPVPNLVDPPGPRAGWTYLLDAQSNQLVAVPYDGRSIQQQNNNSSAYSNSYYPYAGVAAASYPTIPFQQPRQGTLLYPGALNNQVHQYSAHPYQPMQNLQSLAADKAVGIEQVALQPSNEPIIRSKSSDSVLHQERGDTSEDQDWPSGPQMRKYPVGKEPKGWKDTKWVWRSRGQLKDGGKELRVCLGVMVCTNSACQRLVRPKTEAHAMRAQLQTLCQVCRIGMLNHSSAHCSARTYHYTTSKDGIAYSVWEHVGIHEHPHPPGGRLSKAQKDAVDTQVARNVEASVHQLRTGDTNPHATSSTEKAKLQKYCYDFLLTLFKFPILPGDKSLISYFLINLKHDLQGQSQLLLDDIQILGSVLFSVVILRVYLGRDPCDDDQIYYLALQIPQEEVSSLRKDDIFLQAKLGHLSRSLTEPERVIEAANSLRMQLINPVMKVYQNSEHLLPFPKLKVLDRQGQPYAFFNTTASGLAGGPAFVEAPKNRQEAPKLGVVANQPRPRPRAIPRRTKNIPPLSETTPARPGIISPTTLPRIPSSARIIQTSYNPTTVVPMITTVEPSGAVKKRKRSNSTLVVGARRSSRLKGHQASPPG